MFLPLREIDVFGVLVAPAAVMLAFCAVVFLVARWVMNQFVDLNRYVWRSPLVEIAWFIVLYCLAVLTMRVG
jgi:hypothetical protein